MRNCASILKPQGKAKWMHFIPLINPCSRNSLQLSASRSPGSGLWGHWTGTGATHRREGNLQKFAGSAAVSLWAGDFIYWKNCILLILPKKISNSLILEGGHKYAVPKWPQMPGLGCLHPRDRQDFTQPCSMFPGLVDRFWSCPDIPNLLHGLYRMLNSVSRESSLELWSNWITLSFLQHPIARPSCINKHGLAEVCITSLIYVCLDFGLRILIYYLVS